MLQWPIKFVTGSEGGGVTWVLGLGLPQPHSSICLIPLWLAALKRPSCVPGPHVGLGRVDGPAVSGFAHSSR